jgi:muramoyltetrapeptide carboxypeptidase
MEQRSILRDLVAPPRVRAGDTVAIISPSAPAVGWWPHRVERGRAYLESLSLKVRVMPNAGGKAGWVSASPEARAADIHEAFLDDRVRVVLASIGGNHANQILPHLDFELLAAHPKILQGYSDVTVLLWAIAQRSGLRTFHGPALTVEMAEFPAVLPYTDRFLDFFTKADLSRARGLRPSPGWITLRSGVAEGPLVGGCLETICWHLKGSAFWPDLSGAILFLETSEEAPSPAHVDAYLTDLEQLGVFDSIAGLILGRPMRYTDEQAKALWHVAEERTASAGIPVLGNVDLGHTDPMLTLPIGVAARVDAGGREFRLLESATAPA